MKEYGKKLSRNQIWNIAHKLYITNHGHDRIQERTNLCGKDMNETLVNVGKAIVNCAYAFNNNDGSISVVLHNGQVIILTFDDEWKRWHFVTIKDVSENGITPSEKRKMLQRRTTIDKSKNKNRMKMTERDRYQVKNKAKKPYKRDKSWKGEW